MFRLRVAGLVLLIPLLAGGDSPLSKDAPRPFEPTDRYERRSIEGWPVLVNKAFLTNHADLASATLALLEHQLYQIKHKVPAAAVAKLQKVRIWVEENEPHHPCMAYHPDPGWLRAHGMNPDKARCVEVANAHNFLTWTREQPWMVLHELAHAYHHQVLDAGFDNPELRAAFHKATEAKLYAKVLHYDGKEVKAYATTNPMEYFAESTEAFFGANDFYPFVRAELQRHDPTMDSLLLRVWGGDRP